MKKTIKRLSAALLTVLMFSSCGNNDGGGDVSTASEEYAYKAAYAEVTDDFEGELDGYSVGFDYCDGRIYFMSENTPNPENMYTEYFLNSADVSGENFKSVQLSAEENSAVYAPKFDASGTCRFIYIKEENGIPRYFFKSVNGDGEELSSTDITDIITEKFPDGFFPYHAAYDGAGNIYFADYANMLVLDQSGGLICALSETERSFSSLCADKSGKVYAYLWSGSGYDLCGVDTASGALEDAVTTPFDVYGNTFSSGGGEYDFYVSDGSSLFGWNVDGESVELLNWVKSGISNLEVSDIFYAGEEIFVTAGLSHPHGYPKFSMLKKELVNTGDKTEILVAGIEENITSYIENAAIKFNNGSDNYYVTIKKYSYDQVDQLNLDLTSGNIPDVLFTGSYTPTDAYISKGIFADMYEFIDADPELTREDFIPNLLAACETDGKLYRFTDKFSVYTVLGKTSVFGDKQGITVDELNAVKDGMPEGTELFPGFTQRTILEYALQLSGSEFIDYKKGTCDFTSESFIKMLEFANGFISDIDSETYFDDSFWGRYDTMFADGSALLMIAFLTDYADVYSFERCNFDEQVTAVGFPCENRVGNSFAVDSGFSISAKSENKEGAWEFVRTLLLPEYQDLGDKLPARKDSLEKLAQTAMKHDPDRVYNPIVMMGDMALSSGSMDIGEPKQEDIDRFNEIIASANGLMSYNSKIMEIVDEEAATYFSGSKSAEDAAALIQTRVQLYLDENA